MRLLFPRDIQTALYLYFYTGALHATRYRYQNQISDRPCRFYSGQLARRNRGSVPSRIVAEMATRGYSGEVIDFFEVAGAFEIPLHAKLLAKSGRYAAIVGAGLVVDGGIYRHEFFSQAVISGLMQVQLETEVPVISVVLTPHHFHSHGEHHGFFFEHFQVKGREAAHACADTIKRLQQIDAIAQDRIAA